MKYEEWALVWLTVVTVVILGGVALLEAWAYGWDWRCLIVACVMWP